MFGGMQDFELRVPRLLDHAEREHGGRELVTAWADGRIGRTNWANIAADARRLAQALERMGVKPGDRVATLAMNHHHHVAAFYGVIGMGGVVHTINPRLFDEQLVYIANHAEDKVLLYDKAFQPIVDRLKSQWTSITHYVCFDDGAFEALLEAESGDYRWVEGPERDPCMLCYTSGTTGNPKGVLYEHRSSIIHAMALIAPSCFDLAPTTVALPIVPMFHAAAWAMPFAGAMAGVKLVYAQVNDPVVLCRLMNDEKVTHSAGVPTVWLSMFQHIDATGNAPRYLKTVTIGGSAAPRAMIERLMKMGIRVGHAWGMTETSPIGTIGAPPANCAISAANAPEARRPVGWPCVSPASSAPRSNARRAMRSGDRPSSRRAHHRPTGALRMTPPQPLLSFAARSPRRVMCSSADRHVAPGTRCAKSSRTENSQPSRSKSATPGVMPCVASQRAYAFATNGATAARSPRAAPATFARSSPSAVNSVICVSSVIAPLRSNAVVNSLTPPRPNMPRISASDMNSTGAPSASPTAPPRRQPR